MSEEPQPQEGKKGDNVLSNPVAEGQLLSFKACPTCQRFTAEQAFR